MIGRLGFSALLFALMTYTGLARAVDEVHTGVFAWSKTELTGNGGANPAVATVPLFDDQGGARVLTQVAVEIRGDLTTGGDPNNNPPAEDPPVNTGYTTSGTLTNNAVQAQTFIFKIESFLFRADVLPGAPASLTAAVALLPSPTLLNQQTYINVPAGGSVPWGPTTVHSTTTTQTVSTTAALTQFVGTGSFGYSATTILTQTLSGGGGNVVSNVNTAGRFEIKVTYSYNTVRDFGDNPDGYATLLASNGPSHLTSRDLLLGSCVDVDANGQPSAGADGDDTNVSAISLPAGVTCNDDEDGVLNPADLSFIDGDTKTITFALRNSIGVSATLSGWIDFNCNGQFDAGERSQTSVASGATSASLTFSAPVPRNSNCAAGDISTYARFRLSTDAAAQSPTGAAANGEVEDYLIHLNALSRFFDQGDAPASYGTSLGANGPSHEVTELLTDPVYLGQCVDSEDDGQPSANAAADDTNLSGPPNSSIPAGVACGDDEDGIVNPADLTFKDGATNQKVTLNVTNASSLPATLSGWIDFDCSGTFDLDERVQAAVGAGVSGTLDLLFSAPLPRDPGCSAGSVTTYARFRMSTDGAAQSPTGPALDGEVEDHVVLLSEADRFYDQGDAPNSYATLLASNGPGHEVTPVLTPTLYMGQCVDSEDDGQPSAGADGDDTNAAGLPNSSHPAGVNCSDDEDGVTSADLTFVDGQTKQVNVNVTNASGLSATLSGWVDFNCSGSFDNPGERSQAIVPAGFSGNMQLTFSAPAPRNANCDTGLANTYARFRLSTDPVASAPTGDAADGEVEDYTAKLDFQAASLGDTVWEDTNGNGQQDESGTGIPGVTINLSGSDGSTRTTTTGAGGSYLFNDLVPGITYTASCVAPTGYGYTSPAVQTPQTEGDNNADGSGAMGSFTLGSGESDLSVDCGLVKKASLGDTVWEDTNGNGQQDESGTGIPGVTINLSGSDGSTRTTTTGAGGSYLFNDLVPGITYTASCVAPTGYGYTSPAVQTPQTEGDNNADGSGAMGAFTLGSGESDLSVDCGLVKKASLGDTVWEDTNGNGQQDESGTGIPGVTINLSGSDGSTRTTTTGAGGSYLFNDLVPGITYTASCVAPAGYSYTSPAVQTPQTEGDNNADGSGAMGSFTLGSGESDLSVDCGLVKHNPMIDIEKATNGEDADTPTGPVVAVGSTVTWTYVVKNTGNVALSNVSVTDNKVGVITCPKTTLAVDESMTCTATGTAQAGQYVNNATATGTPPSGPDVTDQDPSHYYGENAAIDIEKATNGQDADNPTGPQITVGGGVNWTYVVTNTGNVALSDVAVTDDKGVVVSCPKTALAVAESMTCTASGIATAGQYANLGSVTGKSPSGTSVQDSDPSHYIGVEQPAIDIEKATNGHDADSPTGPEILVGDPVNWTYVVRNTGDVPLTGVSVVDNQGVAVSCPKSTLAVGESMTCTASGTAVAGQYANLGTTTGQSPGGQTVTDNDPSHYFGKVPVYPASIGNEVFDDLNRNGVRDAGEPGVAGAVISITGPGGYSASFTTGADGLYQFTNLVPGAYTLSCAKPAGYVYTTPFNLGSIVDKDSNADPNSGAMGTHTLASGESNQTIDCGVRLPDSICLPTFDFETDAAGNALQRGQIIDDEWASLGVQVTSSDPTRHPVMVFDSANPTGGDVDLGTPNSDFGGPGIGTGGKAGTPGENALAMGKILILTEDRDASDPDDNAGGGDMIFTFDQPVRVDRLAVLDIEEAGGSVKAYDALGNLVASAPLQVLGDNSFQYVTLLTSNVSRLVVHFAGSGGLAELAYCLENLKAAIGDRVWNDLDRDGIQDAGEAGIAGVTVNLLDAGGTVIATTTTNAVGLYGFGNLNPGSYRLEIVPPAGSTLSPSDQGGDDAKDSDFDRTTLRTALTTLDPGEFDPTWDAGLYTEAVCSACDGKVSQLTLQYNGDTAAWIKVKQKDGTQVFSGQVEPGGQFTFSGEDKKGTLGTEISIYVDGALDAKIHTSCSQPIGPGLVVGDFEVIEGYSRNGGLLCPITPPPAPDCGCDGKVTSLTLKYTGTKSATITVKQKDGTRVYNATVQPGGLFTVVGQDKKGTLGTEIRLYVNGKLDATIHTSCSQPIGPGLTAGSFLVTDGSSRNIPELCPLETPPPPPADECGCDGKVSELTLQYNGSKSAWIKVKQKDGTEVFSGSVQPDGQFSFTGQDKKGTLGTEINIYVDGKLNASIHTSCSQPIGPGLVAGSFVVVEGSSRNTPALCPLDNPPPPPVAGTCETDVTGSLIADGLGSFKNTSKSQSYLIGIASYKKFDEVIDNQVLYDHQNVTINPGQTLELGVQVPDCAAQIDMFCGEVLMSLNGQRYGDRKIDWEHIGGTDYCDTGTGGSKKALLVIGGNLGSNDKAVKSRLEALGFQVTVKSDVSASASDASGKALVAISSSVQSGNVGTKFRDLTIPVVTWESWLYDDMKMTGTVADSDFGTDTDETEVKVVSTHALAAGLKDKPKVYSSKGTLRWGKAGSSAIVALKDNDNRFPVLFGYETGASMVGMKAPARRVGLFIDDATPTLLTSDGWKLFDAAIKWAAGM